MKLSKTQHVQLNEISQIIFDVAITSAGYESRARFFIQQSKIISEKKYCLGFTEYSDNIVRKSNNAFFESLGFEMLLSSGNTGEEVLNILSDNFSGIKKDEVNILVDYSCMTRLWYSAILKFFAFTESSSKTVNIFFCYSFSKFLEPPKQLAHNKYVGPLDGFYSVTIPSKPSALIIGLGYIQERAFGLSEFFDVEPYIFISDSGVSEEFYNAVCINNKILLNSINPDNIFYYPLLNLKYTETLLFNLTKDLQDDYRIILAPSGPKPFTLISLLTALRFDFVDVWRISAGEKELPVDKEPSGLVSIYQAQLV